MESRPNMFSEKTVAAKDFETLRATARVTTDKESAAFMQMLESAKTFLTERKGNVELKTMASNEIEPLRLLKQAQEQSLKALNSSALSSPKNPKILNAIQAMQSNIAATQGKIAQLSTRNNSKTSKAGVMGNILETINNFQTQNNNVKFSIKDLQELRQKIVKTPEELTPLNEGTMIGDSKTMRQYSNLIKAIDTQIKTIQDRVNATELLIKKSEDTANKAYDAVQACIIETLPRVILEIKAKAEASQKAIEKENNKIPKKTPSTVKEQADATAIQEKVAQNIGILRQDIAKYNKKEEILSRLENAFQELDFKDDSKDAIHKANLAIEEASRSMVNAGSSGKGEAAAVVDKLARAVKEFQKHIDVFAAATRQPEYKQESPHQ